MVAPSAPVAEIVLFREFRNIADVKDPVELEIAGIRIPCQIHAAVILENFDVDAVAVAVVFGGGAVRADRKQGIVHLRLHAVCFQVDPAYGSRRIRGEAFQNFCGRFFGFRVRDRETAGEDGVFTGEVGVAAVGGIKHERFLVGSGENFHGHRGIRAACFGLRTCDRFEGSFACSCIFVTAGGADVIKNFVHCANPFLKMM